MIDKAQIERWLEVIEELRPYFGSRRDEPLQAHERAYRVFVHDLTTLDRQNQLLTDYLALREIVEALADLDPTIGYVRHGIGDCLLCGVAVPHHLGKCPVKMAVALVGPASGARVGEEPE